jgi:hypothetical protein
MKLYENFEKAYKLILESSKYKQLKLDEECNPEKLGKDKIVDEMINFFTKSEEYEKCSILLKIKCWRHHQDKKYNL